MGFTAAMVSLLLAVFLVPMALSVHRESVTWDEGDHLFARLMSLRTGDFGLNPEHPPMAKMVAALPLLPLNLRVPPLQGRMFKDESYFDVMFLARLHIFPEIWLYGLADVRLVANATPTYLLGKVYAHGSWRYFPLLLLIKLTLGMLSLLAIAVFAMVRGWIAKPRELWYVLFSAAFYFLIAAGSGLNIGVRHILPCLPLLILFAAAGGVALARRGRAGAAITTVLLLAHTASSALAFPPYLPYSNEAWGGRGNTWRYLSDSNVDWGQQLPQVASWLRANHATQDCHFAYFVTPFILPTNYGVPCALLPTFDSLGEMEMDIAPRVSGTLLISQGDLNGFEYGTVVRNPYQALVGLKPYAVIDDGVFVFRGTFDLPDAAAIAPTQRATRALAAHNVVTAISEATRRWHSRPATSTRY